MKRTISVLNDMSFVLPEGWSVTTDKYNMPNGQGFINIENYLSNDGKVISFFAVQRDPIEFLESYSSLAQTYNERDGFILKEEFSIAYDGFSFPVYILEGVRGQSMTLAQVFVNCGDCLGCFMIFLENYSGDFKEFVKKDKLFGQLSKILRTVE